MIKESIRKNLGIIDLEIYIPRYYVDQNDLEVHDKVDKGKYTIGLGQHKMAFVGDREDINSICLTVLDKLLKRNNILPKDVGRLEVGTETFLDKSKSIKTYLMDFFKESNNDIEGITTSNACYGGTSALFNAIDWVSSDFYDGRYAIVISADIAVYSKGKARPTGGCGAIAMLIGPDASIQFENVRSTYMNNVYDFFKPNPSSEYPVVDGVFSIDCYFKALESCYEVYLKKQKSINHQNANLNYFDFFCFHSPFTKMVEKAFVQLISYDLQNNNKNLNATNSNNYYNSQDELIEIFAKRTKNFKLEPKLMTQIKSSFNNLIKNRLAPGLFLSRNLGNIYTGSLYTGLLSLILNKDLDLSDKRVMMFSYGSGCAASMYTLKFNSDRYLKIRQNNSDVMENLDNRMKKSPDEFEKILFRKEKLYLSNNYEPEDNIENLFDGTYYIEKVDDQWRRVYVRKGKEERRITYNKLSNINNSQENMTTPEKRLSLIKSQLIQYEENKSRSLPRKIIIEDNMWSGFHKKSIHERLLQIKKVYPQIEIESLKTGGLNLIRADNMIENCIGMISLPIGLCLNLTVNSKKYNVPMAVEEPSVIAAVSNSAKLITEHNGFFCYSDPSLMITQIHYSDTNTNESEKLVEDNKTKLITVANGYCQEMVQRGGGVRDVYTRVITPSSEGQSDGRMVIEVIVDVCDSMGANTLSTVAEGLANYLDNILQGTPILKILSNLAIYRKSTAEFKINVNNLEYKGLTGIELARRIVEAYEIAAHDPFRAATHNKGIMNGIDAVAIALGQDWRAIEAGAHSYASFNMKSLSYDSYKPLTYFKIIEVKGEKFLYGNLTMPLSVGVVGGAINSNENYQNMMKLLGNPNSQQLAHIMVAIGLAQNFAALRALVSEGIQKGHMGLHARNFAIKAGVPDYLIPDVVNFMKNNKSISVNAAKKYLDSFNIYTEMRGKDTIKTENGVAKDLSSFFIEIDYSFLKEPIVMNFLLNTKIIPPIHFSLRSRKMKDDDVRVTEIFKVLFGEQKHEDWLHEFIKFVNHFDFSKNTKLSELNSVKYKMKMIVILLYVCSYNILQYNFTETKIFLERMLSKNYKYEEMLECIPNNPIPLNFGLSVILELYENMKFYFSTYVKYNPTLPQLIINEIEESLRGFIKMSEMIEGFKIAKINLNDESFNKFLDFRLKRLNCTVMLLSDMVFSEETFSESTINSILALAKYLEIKITLQRDFKRYNEKENKLLNSFALFIELSKSRGMTDMKLIERNYFNLMQDEKIRLKNIFKDLTKIYDDFFNVVKNVETDFEDYYKLKNDEKKNIPPKF